MQCPSSASLAATAVGTSAIVTNEASERKKKSFIRSYSIINIHMLLMIDSLVFFY
ncbi:hypothetical protein Mapa_009764 [Marchantia paleacea]|nr:hypothetical protein Mapa_009764 [Marchantia paleacea]